MKFQLEQYLESSTIHGFVYITRKYHLIERLFWLITLIASVICTAILIEQLISKIENFPIVIYISVQSESVSKIDYPAITICSGLIALLLPFNRYGVWSNDIYNGYFEEHTNTHIKYNYEEFLEATSDERKLGKIPYMKILDKIEKSEIKIEDLGIKILKRLQVVDLVSKRGVFDKKNFTISTSDFLKTINEFEKWLRQFVYQTEFRWFEDLFIRTSEILTEHGLCNSFNIARSEDAQFINLTSNDFHYQLNEYYRSKNRSSDTIKLPRRSSTSLQGLSFETRVDEKSLTNVVNLKDSDGHLLFVHDPFELPSSLESSEIPLPSNQVLHIWIEPQLFTIDESLIDLKPSERNCFLEDERKLNLFKIYTKNNCEQECLTSFMIDQCGCAEYFMIRNFSTEICPASKKSCFDSARKEFQFYRTKCNCLPSCNYIKYNVEIERKRYHRILLLNHLFGELRSETLVRFKKNVYNKFIRKKQFDQIDFISFVGGILGLFAGFSALSFIEIVYWFIVRVVFRYGYKISALVHPTDIISQENEERNIFRNYIQSSSIHGLSYFTDKNPLNRYFWIIAFILSITACGYLISQTNEKLPNSRVIAFDDHLKFRDDLTFPAFTIIPDRVRYLPFMTDISNRTFWASKYPEILKNKTLNEEFLINQTNFGICPGRYIERRTSAKDIITIDYVVKVMKMTSGIEWFTQNYASWNQKFLPNFTEIRTTRGIGFTFNLMNSEKLLNFNEISDELKYQRNISMDNYQKTLDINNDKYPLKISVSDRSVFTIKIKERKINEQEGYKKCLHASFLVHHPDFLPTFSDRGDFNEIKYGMALDIEVTPEIIKTDKDLRKLTPELRDCYFDGEKSLKFFKLYTQKNCEIECLTNYTNKFCNCSELTMPYNEEKGINFCIPKGVFPIDNCAFITKRDLFQSENFSIEKNCSCLPACDTISYHINYFSQNDDSNETIINLRMNTDNIILYRRYQQFTSSDVVSYVGGLLGLFAGISMLSIFEIFYFFVFKVIHGKIYEYYKHE